ncbi:MAG: DNA-processing protein DprA [Clostridia bacterium]|jgi:DNA processing protein|nr:DNA-processing protein DprA [Clostridia bacterium]
MGLEEKYYAAAFHQIFQLNLNSCHKLLFTHFSSWQEAWENLKDAQSIGVPPALAELYNQARPGLDAERLAEEMANKGIDLLTSAMPDFAKTLLQISNIPCILYYCGDIRLLNSASLAVIGSRQATPYGLNQARLMSGKLAEYGLTIVSGLARGIDAAAHEGALGAGGKTVAVIGSGLDRPYPRENLALFKRIKEYGLVISEFPPGTAPLKINFPIRNRIISGLSKAVFIIEARARSGTLITCDAALEQGKDVFALPGPVTSANSIGTLRLIQQGAKLVIYPEDILQELGMHYQEKLFAETQLAAAAGLGPDEKDLLAYIFYEPVHIDKLLVNNDKKQGVYELLMRLEIKGLIKQLPGKYYIRV